MFRYKKFFFTQRTNEWTLNEFSFSCIHVEIFVYRNSVTFVVSDKLLFLSKTVFFHFKYIYIVHLDNMFNQKNHINVFKTFKMEKQLESFIT